MSTDRRMPMSEQPYREPPKRPEYLLKRFEQGTELSTELLNKTIAEGFEPLMMSSSGPYSVTILLVRR
jgi:hypothetical protein